MDDEKYNQLQAYLKICRTIGYTPVILHGLNEEEKKKFEEEQYKIFKEKYGVWVKSLSENKPQSLKERIDECILQEADARKNRTTDII